MKVKDEVKKYLEEEVQYRERINKDRGHVNLLLRFKKFEAFANIPKPLLVEFVREYTNRDRVWRKILMDYPNLRGSDYYEKGVLEQEKKLELGYEVGLAEDIRKGKTL